MKNRAAAVLPVLLFSLVAFGLPRNLFAAPAPSSAVLSDKAELAEREKALQVEEKRLLGLRKEIDEKIAKYEKLLSDIEAKEKERVEREKEEKRKEAARKEEERIREAARKEEEERKKEEISGNIDMLVKLFESMPPEDAATRMEEIDEEIAATILSRMKGRRAGSVLAAMNPKKSAVIVHKIAGNEKNFPEQ